MKSLPVTKHARKETLAKIKELHLQVAINQAIDAPNPQIRRAQKNITPISKWVGIDTLFTKQESMSESVENYLSIAEMVDADSVYWIPVTRVIKDDVVEYIECDKISDSVHGVTGWLYALKNDVRNHYAALGKVSPEWPVTKEEIKKEESELLRRVKAEFFLKRMQEQAAWENGEIYNITAYSLLDHKGNSMAIELEIYNTDNRLALSVEDVVGDCYQNITMSESLKSLVVEFSGSEFRKTDRNIIAKEYLVESIKRIFNIRLVVANVHYREGEGEDLDRLTIDYLPESFPAMKDVEKVRGEGIYKECIDELHAIKSGSEVDAYTALQVMKDRRLQSWSDELQQAFFNVMAKRIDKIKSIKQG